MTKQTITRRFLHRFILPSSKKHPAISQAKPAPTACQSAYNHCTQEQSDHHLVAASPKPTKKHHFRFSIGILTPHTKKNKTKNQKRTATKNLHKGKVIIFLLLMLVVVPAQASVFDPLLRALLPFYEKITSILPNNKNDAATISSEAATETAAKTDVNAAKTHDNTLNLSASTPYSFGSQLTQAPDLLALLHAEFAADRDEPLLALALYKEQSFKNNATAVFERALTLSMQLESPTASLAFAKAWQEQNPDHIPAWFYVAHLAVKAEDYATATQSIRAILSYDSKADLNQIFAGILPHSLDAKRQLLAALQNLEHNNNSSLSVLKAGLLMQLNEPAAALLHLNEALKAEPTNLAYLTLKADALKYLGDDDALHQFLNEAIAAVTGDAQKQLYLYQIRHLIDESDLTTAWTILKTAQQRFDGDIELTLLASLVALDVHEYDDARVLLTQLSKHPATQSEAYYYLGISYERTQNFKEALAYFQRVDDMQFVLPATQKQVAYELLFDNPDAAIAALIKLRQRYEMYASDSYTLQADILLRQGKKDQAVALLGEAYHEYPDDGSLLYAYTKLLDDKNDYSQKQANIQTLLEQEPDNPSYQLEQARLELLQNPDDLLSLDTATRISQIDFNHPQYDRKLQLDALIVLATNALAHHRYQAVIDYLQPAYSVAPSINVGVLLLRAYQGLGDTQAVNELLYDLQARFDGNNPPSQALENY